MELKARLEKPYDYKERANFVIDYNHKLNYIIEETDDGILAWDYTDDEQTERRVIRKKSETKAARDKMINDISWRVERAREQKELGIPVIDDYKKLLEYHQYLRDFPQSSDDWWEKEIKTYEEWLKLQEK